MTLTGANQCTVAPILTIAAPGTACATGSTVTKCIANVCTGTKPTDAPFCTDDTKINGHEDVVVQLSDHVLTHKNVNGIVQLKNQSIVNSKIPVQKHSMSVLVHQDNNSVVMVHVL